MTKYTYRIITAENVREPEGALEAFRVKYKPEELYSVRYDGLQGGRQYHIRSSYKVAHALQELVWEWNQGAYCTLEDAPSEDDEGLEEDVLPWRKLSEEDQELIASAKIDEVHECAREIAHDMLDQMSDEEIEEYLAELRDEEE